MPIEAKPIDPVAFERLVQLRACLNENEVPRPHIIWIHGKALIPLLARIGKEPFPRDGMIFHEQLYRFNLDTGRFRKEEPRPRG